MTVKYKGSGTVTDYGIANAAGNYGIEVNALKAVMAVETNGKPFDKSGRLSMLFEPHIFYKLLKAHDTVALGHAVSLGLAYEHQGEHPYPSDSYPHFLAACVVDEEMACQSASWGMGQIMGENHADAGYDTAVAMVEHMALDPNVQVSAMAGFIHANHLVDKLNAHDWAGFARGYNGKNFAKNHYDTKLAIAYKGEPISPRLPSLAPKPVVPAVKAAPAPAPIPVAGLRDRMAAAAKAPPPAPAPKPLPPQEAPQMDPLKLISAIMPGASAAPTPAAGGTAPLTEESDIRWAQQRLTDLGYFEVGLIDGKPGKRTEGAILAFRNENGLPLDPNIDDDLKLALISAKPRAVSTERANATVASLRPASPILKAAWWTKALSIVTGVVGIAASYFASINGDIGQAQSQLSAFKIVFAFLPPWSYGAATVVLGTVIFFQAHSAELARLKQFQTGRAT